MAEFTAIPKVDLTAAAVDQLRDAILLGSLAAGDELPSERELALQLGLNRTTVREALTRLELLGLIDRRHGKRAVVLNFRRTGSASLVTHLARLGVKGVGSSIRETIDIVYGGTAALAAQRRTKAGLAALDAAAAALEQAVADGSDDEVVAADREFHHVVASLARSVSLELMVNDFYRAFDASYDASGSMKRGIPKVLRALAKQGTPLPHRRMTEAIATGDEQQARDLAHLMVTGSRAR